MKNTEIIKNLIKQFSTDNSNHWTYRSNIIKCLKALNVNVYERKRLLDELQKNGEIEAFEVDNETTCYGLVEHESQKGNFYKYYISK